MKAQTFASQALNQDPADTEPQRITACQYYSALIALKRQQRFTEREGIIAGDALQGLAGRSPLLECRQQAFWGCY